jgi:hypothetical protein
LLSLPDVIERVGIIGDFLIYTGFTRSRSMLRGRMRNPCRDIGCGDPFPLYDRELRALFLVLFEPEYRGDLLSANRRAKTVDFA